MGLLNLLVFDVILNFKDVATSVMRLNLKAAFLGCLVPKKSMSYGFVVVKFL